MIKYIPNKFTFTVYDPDLIFTATRSGDNYLIEWTVDSVYNRLEYALFYVEQFLTPKPFNDTPDWIIKEIIETDISSLDIRKVLTCDIPSIDLQQAALAEIIRLDAIIAKLHDSTVERFLDGEAYNIPIKRLDEFNRDIEWASDEDSDERWDALDGKYNQYKV